MFIKIKKHGHQYYSEISGEVLSWCQTVEEFQGVYLQVPCVIIKTKQGLIQTIPLKQQLYHYEITEEEKIGM